MLELKYDVAVVGGGIAGLTAAMAAKEHGAGTVVMLEKNATLGGALNQKENPEFTVCYQQKELFGPEFASEFSKKAQGAGVEILLRSHVMDIIKGGKALSVNSMKGMTYIEAKSIVLATGFQKNHFTTEQKQSVFGKSIFSPNDKLSRGAGVMMSPVTSGPVVNQYMQTSIANIFACGNAVHVNHLMDFVLREGEKAGKYAAKFAMETFRPAKGKTDLETVPGENVKYVCPQKLSLCQENEEIDMFFCVNEAKDAVKVSINCGEREIFAQKKERVLSGEMVHVAIHTKDIPAHVGYVVVDVKGTRA